MSLYKDASLVMIPTAYKDGKLYSIRPTDGSGDFTFSRGSNLAATRVDVNGLIEKGRENQILHSNAITTSPWGGPRIFSETQGHTGYDGSNNAWLIIPTTDNNTHYKVQSVSTTSGVNTISVYAKAGGYNYMTIRDDSGGSSYAKFDLANGLTESSGSNVITSKIESVGNGWYRCSLTYLETGTGNVLFYINETYSLSSVYTGDEVSGVYFQDFQVELGMVATDYIETGASTAQAGILEDMPRLDYSGGASCPSLLLEPQRTNLVSQSEYFGSATWIKNFSSITSNAVISPDGALNAGKLVENTDNTSHHLYENFTAVGVYTFSVFAKKGEREYVYLYSDAVGRGKSFNLVNGTIDANIIAPPTNATIEDYGNGWYKCSMTIAANSGAFRIGNCLSSGVFSYQGDGSSGIYIYGAQLEAGSHPTSYIPCMGTSQTRSEDSANTDISSYYVQNGSTLFFEVECDGEVDESNVTALLRLGTSVNTTRVSFLQGYNRIYTTWYDGNTGALGTINTLDAGDRVKVAVQIANDGIGRMNGGVNGIGNTIRDYTLSSENYTRLEIYLSSRFKQLMIFPTLLTASEMEALTTL
jgi:hypothetical protein